MLGLGAVGLALILVVTLLLPRGDDGRRPGLTHTAYAAHVSLAHAHAGLSAVTSGAATEIDQVVAQGLVSARRVDARSAPSSLVAAQVRCAVFEGQRYCLHTGWTQRSVRQVVRSASAAVDRQAARPVRHGRRSTGDATLLSTLQSDASRTPQAQAAADRAELTQAAESVAKVWLLRHQIQHVRLPAGFLADHPEVVVPTSTAPAGTTGAAAAPAARIDMTSATKATAASAAPVAAAPAAAVPAASPAVASPAAASPAAVSSATPAVPATSAAATPPAVAPSTPAATAPFKPNSAYPQKARIIDPADTAEQTRTYWCGPTAMQMIAWGWSGTPESQDVWAQRLGTTSSGTSINAMVAVTNRYTNWDRADYAGPYIVLDVRGWTFRMWWRLLMRHIVDYRAPEILHPILLKQWYPYLDHDESGHFQVGRGYNKRGARSNSISYFEPFNQQRFDPSEPYIARVQWRGAYKSYRANLDHFAHNIGV